MKTLERRRPKRGELNYTAFLFWECLVILGLEQEIWILGFEPTAASEQELAEFGTESSRGGTGVYS